MLSVLLSRSAEAGRSAEAFFDYAGIDEILVSPDGRWLAAAAHGGEDATVLIQQVGNPHIVALSRSKEIGRVAWESPDALIFETVSSYGLFATQVARLTVDAGEPKADVIKIRAYGRLVDALPLIPDAVLWEIRSDDGTSLHRVSIQELVDFEGLARAVGKTVDYGRNLAAVRGSADHWVVDRNGEPRAVLRSIEADVALMLPAEADGAFRSVYRFAEDDDARSVVPVGLAANGNRLIVLAYDGKDTRGLYEFDASTGRVSRPIFVHEDFDVRDVLRDPLTGDLVAAIYDEGGEARYHYFREYQDRFLAKLPAEWSRETIQISSGTIDRQVFVYSTSSEIDPGTFYVRDRQGGTQKIGERGSNIGRDALVPVETFKVRSSDGTEVEAYLTLPRGASSPVPLVVMPHGGPFGARDSRVYDPLVQYLASWNFAVLQMNFRGSEGYGLAFQNKVKKAWAKGIEDDIDAAVEHAMALQSVDESRICIVGMSYGGFSSLASVIRHPDRYRCAVSIAGVTDVPLMAESSDFSDSKTSLASWKKLVGDPGKERAEMLAVSPAYHAESIAVPVLIIQGTDDRRVDPDHAHRMALMLELYDKPFEMLEVEDAGHGFDRDGEIIIARVLRRFVSPHLRPGESFEADPRVDHDRH